MLPNAQLGGQDLSRLDEFVEQLRPYCEKVSAKTSLGVLLTPQADVLATPKRFIEMYRLVSDFGGEWHPDSGFFVVQEKKAVQEFIKDIELKDFVAGPNPRLQIDEASVEDLFADIRDNGMRERIKVRPSKSFEGKFEVVDGNRRVKVATLLGWATIRAVVVELSDLEAYEVAFTVNNNRNGFTPEEKGRYFKLLMEKFPEAYPTQEAVGKRLAITQQRVGQLIQHFEDMEQNRKNNITTAVVMYTERATRVIHKAPKEAKPAIAQAIASGKLTAEKAEEAVKEIKKGKSPEDILESPEDILESPEDILESSLKEAQQEKEREESKRQALVKKLLDFCPKNVAGWTVETFPKVKAPEKLAVFVSVIIEIQHSVLVKHSLLDEVKVEAEKWA
jgi:ParB family chromosome partitioning protein